MDVEVFDDEVEVIELTELPDAVLDDPDDVHGKEKSAEPYLDDDGRISLPLMNGLDDVRMCGVAGAVGGEVGTSLDGASSRR